MSSDLNKTMDEAVKLSSEVKKELKNLLFLYDGFLREANHILLQERMASTNPNELGDFVYLMHLIKRNRDVVGSLNKGISNLRNLSGFSFVEDEDIEKPKKLVTEEAAING